MVPFVLLAASLIAQGAGEPAPASPEELVRQVAAEPAPDMAAITREAETRIRAELIHPDSAEFKWAGHWVPGSYRPRRRREFVYGYITCGTVNSRMTYGGAFTGWQHVILVARGTEILAIRRGEATNIVETHCALYGFGRSRP